MILGAHWGLQPSFCPHSTTIRVHYACFLTNKSRLDGAVDHLFILTSCVLSSKKVDKNTHCSKNIARKDKTLVLPNHIMKHLTLSKNSVESNLESLTEIAELWVPFLFRTSQLHKQARLKVRLQWHVFIHIRGKQHEDDAWVLYKGWSGWSAESYI